MLVATVDATGHAQVTGGESTRSPAPGCGASTGPAASGTVLAGRYRLCERLTGPGRPAVWRATDEVLARPVAVRMLTRGSRRAVQVVAAARAASKISDPRLARVLDADDRADPPYVVTEWPRGAPLRELIAAGPLPSLRAAGMIADAARALDIAHRAGLAHLQLRPDSLWCDPDGSVTITGLAIDAARTGPSSADPVLADTCGLARLLYAALTGYWPGTGGTGLPVAPRLAGRPQCPRQLVPSLPPGIGAIACRALGPESCCGAPILGPGCLAMELAAAVADGQARAARAPESGPAPTLPLPASVATTEPLPDSPPRRRRSSPRAGWRLAGAITVVALLGVAGWLLARGPAATPHHAAGTATSSLRPVTEAAFGPRGERDGDNPGLAGLALGGNGAAAWHTDWYTTATFGNLKPGTGLLLDMGRSVTVTGAEFTIGSNPGADIQLRLGDAPVLADLRVVAHASNAGGAVRLQLARPVRGRYVLIWLTRLPPDSSGTFQASISDAYIFGRG
jgi:hypothetical protein